MSVTERTEPLVPDRSNGVDSSKLESITDKVGPYNVIYHLSYNGEEWLITSVEFEKNRPALINNDVVEMFSGALSSGGLVFKPDESEGFNSIEEAKEVILW